MKKIKSLIIWAWNNEAMKYLFFGGLTTLVYLISRIGLFALLKMPLTTTVIANAIAIIFAFVTNDIWVFNQARSGWFPRFIKFTTARLLTLGLDFGMTFVFVTSYPHLIGQFFNDNLEIVNGIVGVISQILIILINYILSKLFIFDNKKIDWILAKKADLTTAWGRPFWVYLSLVVERLAILVLLFGFINIFF